jgi:hypothetical protein
MDFRLPVRLHFMPISNKSNDSAAARPHLAAQTIVPRIRQPRAILQKSGKKAYRTEAIRK